VLPNRIGSALRAYVLDRRARAAHSALVWNDDYERRMLDARATWPLAS